MEQGPWEANIHANIQEISHILWNPKVHYRSLLLELLLSHNNTVHILFKIHSNIIL
jgi:hypothetical protein